MSVGVGRHQKYAFWQPCCRKLATVMVLHFLMYFIGFLNLKNIDLGRRTMFLPQLGGKLCMLVLADTQNIHSGNLVVEIWQPWWSYTFLSTSIGVLALENMDLGRKIMFLSQLGEKLCMLVLYLPSSAAIFCASTFRKSLITFFL